MRHCNLLSTLRLCGLSVFLSVSRKAQNMEIEAQIEAQDALETAHQGVSKESEPPKSKRGGKRSGAGRKPNLTKILLKGVTRETILAACENVDVGGVIIGLLRSKREQSRIEALHFIFDRLMGKPKQDVSGGLLLLHAHTRDPLLAALPKEAVEALARSYDEFGHASYRHDARNEAHVQRPLPPAQRDMATRGHCRKQRSTKPR
jgi:hypothetical protein